MHIVKVGERHINLEYLIYDEPIGSDGTIRVMVEGGVCLDVAPDDAPQFRRHLDEIAAQADAARPHMVTTIIHREPASAAGNSSGLSEAGA